MKGKKFKLHNIGHLRTWLKTGGGYHGGRAIAQAAKFGEEAIPILIEGFETDGRYVCIDALAKIGKPAVPALLELLEDEPKERDVNLEYDLESYGAGIPNSYEVRLAAIAALGKMREKSAVPIFVERVQNANSMGLGSESRILWEAIEIVEALGRIKTPEALNAIVEALGSPHGKMRQYAKDTMRGAGVSAIPALVRGLKTENENARAEMIRILRYTSELRNSAPRELKNVINNEEEDFLFRFRAIEALDDADDTYALDILLKNITDIDFCEGICQRLQQKEPRNSKDLHSIRKARAEFKRKWGKKDYSSGAYRSGATAMRDLYLNWGGKLSESANRLVKSNRLPRPKILKQNEIKRIYRVRRMNL